MSKLKVLYVCHNHPTIHPGGAEAYALELYKAMRDSDDFDPIFLARIGSTVATTRRSHPGTPFSTMAGDSQQYFFYTETSDFDFFYLTARDKDIYSFHFDQFLRAHQPDIVHFQHTHFLGVDLILQTKQTLPHTPIVYTLHEYLPICHRHGQMVRTNERERCREASPRRCSECFPEISPQSFFMRKRFIQSHFSMVDLFLAPSQFLLERYVDWGIPPEKICFEEYGRQPFAGIARTDEDRPRNRFGFFGQLNFFKGVNVLLSAMRAPAQDMSEAAPRSAVGQSDRAAMTEQSTGESASFRHEPHLWVHGANLELQTEAFQAEFRSLLEATSEQVTFVGSYDHAELAQLMEKIDWVVVPSIWWENSPLVIQEAFAYGRPVICSDIGGMAEKVAHGVNGLHFRAGDPLSLAQTIRHAIQTPGLWDNLRAGIPPVYSMQDHLAALSQYYNALLERAVA